MIYTLMKMVPCEERAEQFLDGQLYCNTLRFFREQPDGDKYEGVIPLPGTLQINDMPGGPSEPPLFVPDLLSGLNAFCMFACVDPISQLGSLRKLAGTFGDYTVVITNVPEFFRRVDEAAKHPRSGVHRCRRGLVDYAEPTGEIPIATVQEYLEVAFQKRKRFAEESEYRFAYLTGREPAGPFILNVGRIRDIAFRTGTEGLYDNTTINGRPLSDY